MKTLTTPRNLILFILFGLAFNILVIFLTREERYELAPEVDTSIPTLEFPLPDHDVKG